MRRIAASFLLAVLAAYGMSASARAAEPAKPLNVLFIAVDDLRPELKCYGVEYMHTPRIDGLAASSVRFDRAYCQVAVCNPSRNSVLSGLRPASTGIYANNKFLRPTLPDVVTLPQHFKNHGYTSLSLGKIFHHSEREPGDDPQSWSEPSWYHGKHQHWFTPEALDYVKNLKKLPKAQQPRLMRGPPFEGADAAEELYTDSQTADQAITTLKRIKDQPFFLGVGFVKPHLPFTCPQKYWDLYPAESIVLPEPKQLAVDAPKPALDDIYELRSYGTVPKSGPIDEAMARNLIRGYRACVSHLDTQVGRVLDELDRLGLAQSTIVVFWGDHGYHLGEQGYFTKMTNFELGTRVPLLVRAPGRLGNGKASAGLVELVDLYPTLAELCKLPVGEQLEGQSFAPLLDDPTKPWKLAAFSEYLRRGPEGFHGRTIRTADFRYTEWTDRNGQSGGVELYDHRIDPKESKNVASEADYADDEKSLAAMLKAGPKKANVKP
ncbi:MAG: sulfatase [Pirellulales bacterium]